MSAATRWLAASPDDHNDRLLNAFKRLGIVLVPLGTIVGATLYLTNVGGDDLGEDLIATADASAAPDDGAGTEADPGPTEGTNSDPSRTTPIEVVYWIGVRADELLTSTDPESVLPEQFVGLPIVESPGDWLMPSSLPIEVAELECTSSACQELTDSDLDDQRRTLWFLVANVGDETLESIEIDWYETPTTPVDYDGPFEVLRASDDVESTRPERLADLSPGDTLMVPVGTVIRVDALGGIRSIPVGDARIPLSLSFQLAGESDRRTLPVREPSQTVISEGYDTTAGERVGVGG